MTDLRADELVNLADFWERKAEFDRKMVHPADRTKADDYVEETAKLLRRLAEAGTQEAVPVAWPANLHPRTLDLVKRFSVALAKKLRLAEEKYGYQENWSRDNWEGECRDHLYQHLDKGDPRDVAAYCAFMWSHGWITTRPAPPAPSVAVKVKALEWPNDGAMLDLLIAAGYDANETHPNCYRGFGWKTFTEKLKAVVAAPPASALITAPQDDVREALVAARDELRLHDEDYQHKTNVEVIAIIDAALRGNQSDGGVEGHALGRPVCSESEQGSRCHAEAISRSAIPAGRPLNAEGPRVEEPECSPGRTTPVSASKHRAHSKDIEALPNDAGAGIKPGPSDTTPSRPEVSVFCERCQGNGEIVTDWSRYLNPHKGDTGEEALSECPDCDGKGAVASDPQSTPRREAGVETIARTISESYGEDPDEFAPRSVICGPNNEPLPNWMRYEEQACALLSAYSVEKR